MIYRNCSRNLVLSARPNLELSAFCSKVSRWLLQSHDDKASSTEHVLWIVPAAVFGGMYKRKGGGSLLRNLDCTVGRPRGAKDGLGGVDFPLSISSLLSALAAHSF